MKLGEPLKQASNALLKGDWLQYQRILRTVPANQETEFLRRLDGILSKIKRKQKSNA